MNHPVQKRLYQSKALHNIAAAGRRSFKTERAKRKLIMGTPYHPGVMTLDDSRMFAGAPTRDQAKRIYWNDLKVMTRPFWKGSPSETDLMIRLDNGSELWVLGMDKPERIEGTLWNGGVLDEYADMKAETWGAHVQPVTADTGAWVDFLGVPDGRNHYYDLTRSAMRSDGWGFFTWKSADVLPADVIARAMETLDERTFRQEYEASFETSGAAAYYAFSTEAIGDYPFDPTGETVMTWDFNATDVKPMVCLLIQRRSIEGGKPGDTWAVTKEFVFRNSNTEETCRAVERFFEQVDFRGSLAVTGDYAGNRRESNASASDYKIIENFFRNTQGYRRKCRVTLAIRDRVAATNAAFRSADGTRRLFIDRGCKELIEDVERTQWKDSGQGLDADGGKRTDESDALSYFPYNWYPIDRQIASPTRIQ